MNNVVDMGGGEEYFAQDYDQVHCRHGNYIGYPGGADFMCPHCEMGENVLKEGKLWKVVANFGDETIALNTFYSEEEADAQVARYEELLKGKSGGKPTTFHVVEKTYQYWDTEED